MTLKHACKVDGGRNRLPQWERIQKSIEFVRRDNCWVVGWLVSYLLACLLSWFKPCAPIKCHGGRLPLILFICLHFTGLETNTFYKQWCNLCTRILRGSTNRAHTTLSTHQLNWATHTKKKKQNMIGNFDPHPLYSFVYLQFFLVNWTDIECFESIVDSFQQIN